jgi:pimeloyl-ACP methyl ester carboxylesterase
MSDPCAWRAPELGRTRRLALARGPLECHVRGDGPTFVFAHGWLANANLWRGVVELLAADFRCVTLDLPFGSHRVPIGERCDLSPAGCGALIAAALEALDLDDVTLVGNDSGGAYSQIAAATAPQRIGRLVLNSCETLYDEFPPPPFDGLPAAARDPQELRSLLGALRDREVRRLPAAYGLLIKRVPEDLVSDSYALPSVERGEILADTARVFAAARSEPIHEAARTLLTSFERPVLFAWSPEDRVFPFAHAERYAAELSDARVAAIDDSYSFTPEDQPAELARALAAFATAAVPS